MERRRKRKVEDDHNQDDEGENAQRKGPAWRDDDDAITDGQGVEGRKVNYQSKPGAPYTSRLKEKFQMTYGEKPAWANTRKKETPAKKVVKLASFEEIEDTSEEEADRESEEEAVEGDDEDEEDDSDYKSDNNRGQITMSSNIAPLKHCVSLNETTRNEGPIIRSISFNPKTNLGLVAGDFRVNVYRVDNANKHPCLHHIGIGGEEVSTARWSHGGNEFYVSSYENSRSFMYCNLETGDVHDTKKDRLTRDDMIKAIVTDPSQRIIVGLGTQGRVHLYSERTKEHIDTFHIGTCVDDAAFDSSGDKLYVQGGDSNGIYVYDMVNRKIGQSYLGFQNFVSEGLAMSENYMACGSVAGIVSVYETPKTDSKPSLLKEFKNLVTPTGCLAINKAEELLAFGSGFEKDAVRLVNLKSMTVMQNFPQNLGSIYSLAFSPNGGYLSVGNNRGKAYLFRMTPYKKY